MTMHLYHWEPNGASARVLIALAEKGLPYVGNYVDLIGGEQFSPEHVARNATGEVPVLVKDGTPMTEASYICEYLEDAHPDAPALMPADPQGRWTVRGWQKYVDDHLAGAISDLAWEAHRESVDPDIIGKGMRDAPTHERRQVWAEHAVPFPADRLAKAREYVTQAIAKVEDALARSPFLAGEHFSLADIAAYAYLAYLPKIAPHAITPQVADWLARIGERDSVRSIAKAGRASDPYAVAAPGPEQTRWG